VFDQMDGDGGVAADHKIGDREGRTRGRGYAAAVDGVGGWCVIGHLRALRGRRWYRESSCGVMPN